MRGGRSHASSPLRNTFLRIPAVRALLAQVSAFAATLLLAIFWSHSATMHLSLIMAAVIQGGFAAILARLFRLAPWWMLIEFGFPVGLVMLSAVQLPSSIYLIAFSFLLILYWSTFRTQVPFYPSNLAAWRAVADLLPNGRPLRIIDIGSGFGGLVMYLARLRPESTVTGIELAPLPWLCSVLRGRASGSAGRFIRGDYHGLSFADFDVVFAYLSPAAMPSLWQKAQAEMRKGTLLFSYEFVIPGIDPDIVAHPSERGPALYGWRIR